MNCAQIKEQLIDFLYGELPTAARTAFEEHLRGCPGCRAEVAGHQRTLARTRSALTGPLLQEPPARARLAIMTAAKTAARPVRQAAKQEKHGFFARLWRTPWLIPAFGAASVATAVFLVRVLQNPEVVPGQRPATIDELVAPAAGPLPQTEPAAAPTEPSHAKTDELVEKKPVLEEESKAAGRNTRLGGRRASTASRLRSRGASTPGPFGSLDSAGRAADSRKSPSRFAEPPPPARTTRGGARDLDDLLAGTKKEGFATPPPAQDQSARQDTETKRKAVDERTPYGRPPLEDKSADQAHAREAAASGRVPPAAPTAAPALQAAPPPRPAYAAPPPPKANRQEPSRMKEAEAAFEEAEGAAMEAPAARAPGAKGGTSFDEEVKKADRLFANRDWGTAAAAYRELLRRFPGNKDAPRWRARMNQSLLAAEQGRTAGPSNAAKAAKAKASTVESAKE